MKRLWTRRNLLKTLTIAGGAGAACGRSSKSRDKRAADGQPSAFQAEQEFQPTLAIALTALGEGLASKAGKELLALGGLNQIVGAMLDDDGEPILLGHHNANLPDFHADDLAIALRSAFRVGPEYAQAPGCTIDPREGAADPWQIQDVKVLGMPANSGMGARFVTADYDLKKASLGLIELKPGVPSLFDRSRFTPEACADASRENQQRESVHRFWFCARYAEAPRYVRSGSTAWIRKPVGVQVLTEKEFLDRNAHRTGGTTADDDAAAYARAVAGLLAPGELRRYDRIRGDFCLIEAARLVAELGARKESLDYLLTRHQLRQTPIPSHAGGLWREENGEIACENAIQETATANGISARSQTRVQKFHQRVRGGVEARIEVKKGDFEENPGLVNSVAGEVKRARPSKKAAVWKIAR